MVFVSDFAANEGLEPGLQYLQSDSWLPPRCDPAYVLHAIRTNRFEACRGRLDETPPVSSNVVERLAVSYALLRESGETGNKPLVMWEMLEALGNEISPEFAELGSDANLVIQVAHELQREMPVDYLRRDLALRSLGRLWNAAFTGPPGYEQYIARSAAGGTPGSMNFFEAVPGTDLTGKALGLYLARLIDLLQAAIALKDLPSSHVGASLQIGDWTNLVGHMDSGRGSHKPSPLALHAQTVGVGPQSRRVTMKVVDTGTGEAIGAGRITVLEGRTGMFDEFIDIAGEVGGGIEKTVRGVFSPNDVVTIYPRVRRLLDHAENQVFRLVVLEGLFVVPAWRSRALGMRLLRQLLVECEGAELALGRPGAYELKGMEGPMAFGVQAGYAAAKLRLAHYWHAMGAEYLFNGVMGMSLPVIQNERDRGLRERLGRLRG